ncbi:S1C family serine protease [Mariniblastus fucicola]|uniref:Periplasmic serine endoprotease DegP n=1 Tax=Mariniblastus fucicola TaxID=980251 RepID=A0A5B9P971_9BACT|nr:S1C family serine protease [Mariniblastus fucicola]QEG21472.1 Periplasmic serine endoprotease DegP precursor [Mariniblastus fucicola]
MSVLFRRLRQRAGESFGAILLAAACAIAFSLSPTTGLAQQSPASIQQLREIEAKVKQVVAQNMNACVSISDGIGAGSGVVVTEGGLVLTAGHVMVGQGEYQILFPDGRTARAKPLGKNLDIDAGMVQIIDPGPWPVAKIGKSKSLSEGDWVVLLGHSGGFELGRKPPVRTGKVLGFNEYQIETDAVLIGGDSGGPLFNLEGELVGIHSSIGDSIAENRHVMTEIFARDYDRMKRGEQWGRLPSLAGDNDGTKPPRMGIVVDRETGLVKTVRDRSPASDAGIKAGDIAREFDGIRLDSGSHLIRLVKEKITGDVVLMKFERNGRLLDFEVRLR